MLLYCKYVFVWFFVFVCRCCCYLQDRRLQNVRPSEVTTGTPLFFRITLRNAYRYDSPVQCTSPSPMLFIVVQRYLMRHIWEMWKCHYRSNIVIISTGESHNRFFLTFWDSWRIPMFLWTHFQFTKIQTSILPN